MSEGERQRISLINITITTYQISNISGVSEYGGIEDYIYYSPQGYIGTCPSDSSTTLNDPHAVAEKPPRLVITSFALHPYPLISTTSPGLQGPSSRSIYTYIYLYIYISTTISRPQAISSISIYLQGYHDLKQSRGSFSPRTTPPKASRRTLLSLRESNSKSP